MKYFFYISLLLIFFSSCKRTQQEVDEISIYNELLDNLYNIEYCHTPMTPTEYCLGLGDTSSIKYKEYNKVYRKIMAEFYTELDSLNLILITKDSLSELNLKTDKDFILRNLNNSDSSFIQLVSSGKIIPSKKIDLADLRQRNIKFSNDNDLDSTFRCEYGRNNKNYW